MDTTFKPTHVLVFTRSDVLMGIKANGKKGYVKTVTESRRTPVVLLTLAPKGPKSTVRVRYEDGFVDTISFGRLVVLEAA